MSVRLDDNVTPVAVTEDDEGVEIEGCNITPVPETDTVELDVPEVEI